MRIIDEALNPYEISIDGYNHSIEEKTSSVDKHGEIIYKNHGYYSNIENTVNKITSLKLDRGQTTTLVGFLDSYREIKNEILKSLEL